MSSVHSRTAVVTGSAQGIGAAISRAFRARGVTVIGVDRQPDSESDEYIQADLSDWDVVMDVAKRTRDADILVNNAAILIQRPVADYLAEDFELLHNINLRAPFLLCREAGAAMAERGFGRIINISSVGARTGGMSDSAVYAASKAGVLAMTRHFARVFAPGGVTSNSVLPGAIYTPMTRAQCERDPAMQRSIIENVPVGRWGTGDDVAEAVTFLASEGASFINGVGLDVNGGWIMA